MQGDAVEIVEQVGDFALGFPVFHVAGARRDLPIRVKFDSVGRVEINALHLTAQTLALGKARHHLQAVAEDEAVRPVLIVLIEFRFGC